MEYFKATVAEIKKLTFNTNSYFFRFDDGKHFNYKAGQFVMLKAEVHGKKVERAYSIASAPPHDMKHAEYIELIIKHVPGGKLTDYLFKLKPGSKIDIAGPYGKFILNEPIKEGDIFMATGSGIAPFIGMLRKIFRDHNPKEFYLFFGARNVSEVIYKKQLVKWAEEHENFHLIVCLSEPDKGWEGDEGYVQDALENHIRDFKNKQVYLCGLPLMVEQSKQRLLELGVKAENIYKEEF